MPVHALVVLQCRYASASLWQDEAENYQGHSSYLTNAKFLQNALRPMVITTGGHDLTVMQWAVARR